MPSRAESDTSWVRQSSKSTISVVSTKESNINTIGVWILRIVLSFILILFIMPFALVLTPWWIWMQPFEPKCPDMMNGYYRLVTWPLTLSKNIRSYQRNDRFIEQLKY